MSAKSKFTLSLGLLAVMAILLVSGCTPTAAASSEGVREMSNTLPENTQNSSSEPLVQSTTGEGVLAYEGTLEQIYQQVSPSVVNIRVVQKVANNSLNSLQLPFFPFFSFPQSQDQAPEQYQSGLGSGFIWDSQEGYIVTNNHVVEGADKIEVTLQDGTVLIAKLVGSDPDSDLAVVKVDLPDGMKAVQFADSNALKVGQLAIAIGNPFGLEGTMTVGIVSALGRSLPVNQGNATSYTIPDIVQTDAPINPGNSGGVLVNDQGQVIGVTAAIESPVDANAGIGFAIPSAIVQKVVPVLVRDGHFDHSWLGISGATLVPDLATAMDLEANQRGVLVTDVLPDSPAEDAGLRGSTRSIEIEGNQVRVGGDVITAIDGVSLNKIDDLIAYLAGNTEVDQKITLTVLRNGKEQEVKVTLKARPGTDETQMASSSTQGGHIGLIGLDMNSAIAEAMDLPKDTQGVLIEQVEVRSPADKAGLQGSYKPSTINGQNMYIGGDVITALDGQPVAGMQELKSLLASMKPGQKVSVSIIREGKALEVTVTLSD